VITVETRKKKTVKNIKGFPLMNPTRSCKKLSPRLINEIMAAYRAQTMVVAIFFLIVVVKVVVFSIIKN